MSKKEFLCVSDEIVSNEQLVYTYTAPLKKFLKKIY